jgi:hypothetical protein
MNQAIANIIKGYISDLDFVDKIAGLTSISTFEIKGKDNELKQFTVPIACCVSPAECDKEGWYYDLMPDSAYKTVIYFEDKGWTFVRSESNWKHYVSNLRLVCWINIEKILGKDCKDDQPCTYAAHIIAEIIRHLPEFPQNVAPFSFVYPEIIDQEIRSASIFSAYTYDEKHSQYLMAPYDYFAINIRTNFAICMKGTDLYDSNCTKLALIATVIVRLTETDMIFSWYGRLISNLPNWLYFPLGGCTKCFSGQVCFWYFLITHFHAYNLFDHLFFTSLGIFLSLIYDKIWTLSE